MNTYEATFDDLSEFTIEADWFDIVGDDKTTAIFFKELPDRGQHEKIASIRNFLTIRKVEEGL